MSRDFVFFEFVIEGFFIDAQQSNRLTFPTLGSLQDISDEPLFEHAYSLFDGLAEGQVRSNRNGNFFLESRSNGIPDLIGQIGAFYLAAGEGHRPLDDVSQLPHIAGPRITFESFQCLITNP